MIQKYFVERRKKLFEKINDNEILILFAGKAPLKSADENYEYTPNRNFFYLTNINEEDDIYVVYKKDDKINEMIFMHRYNELEAKWIGAKYDEKFILELSGINEIYHLDEFESFIKQNISKFNIIYLDLERDEKLSSHTDGQEYSKFIKEQYPEIEVKDAYNLVAKLRMVKDELEISKIQKAIDITQKGIEKMMLNTKDIEYEYQLEAYFDFVIKQNGASDFAFKTIAASGKNAATLHYSKNNTLVNKNDLILFDLGAEFDYYKADITRTFPLSGKFNERQKLIYNIVLKGQEEVMKHIKPGITTKELNQILIDYYAFELKKIGLIEKDEEVRKYYFHGVSHHLGLDTHDACIYGLPLEEGNIITVEPGLYLEDENLGIRIEDDVLITKDGFINLSKNIIKSIDDIEKFMEGK